MKKNLIFCLLILIPAFLLTQNFVDKKVVLPLRFDHYYSYEMVVDALKQLNRKYPGLTRLEIIGSSEEKRAIYCMTVNNPRTGRALDKPGIWVDGNIHGNEIQAGEVCLYLLDYLLRNYSKNKQIKELVDKKCFYVVPVVNVDGRHHFMKEANRMGNGYRGIQRPKDDDGDGLFNEDIYDDLDGDGNICMMRKKDPNGRWKPHPKDKRIMIYAKEGEKGSYRYLGSEGIDNDGDGWVNEEMTGYDVDGNRNWGFDWKPSYVQWASGDYPLSGEGLRGIAEFINKCPNICVVWAFHNTGGMFARGPNSKNLLEYPKSDVTVYDYLGYQFERIVPDYKYLVTYKDMYKIHGGFTEFMARVKGAYTFVGELFKIETQSFKTLKEQQKKKTKSDYYDRQVEYLKFNDHVAHGRLFVEWKPFKHPTYGDIEIGGWVKMSFRLPDPFMLQEMVHRNASAVIFSAKSTPDVSIEVTEMKKMEEQLYRLRVRLKNRQAIPTMSAFAVNKKLYPKDILSLSGKNMKVILGGELHDKDLNRVHYKERKPEVQFLHISGFGQKSYQFILSGSGKVILRYSSRNAGKLKKTIYLK